MIGRIRLWWSRLREDAPVCICTAVMVGTFYLADTPYESGFFPFLIVQALACAAMTLTLMLKYRQSYNGIIKRSACLWTFIVVAYIIAKWAKALVAAADSGKYSSPLNYRTLLSLMGVCLWILSTLLIVRIFSKADGDKLAKDLFVDTFRSVEILFFCFLVLTLLEGFIFMRSFDPSAARRLKLIPFATIVELWNSNLTPFQLFCQYAGNLLLLLPFGFSAKSRNYDRSPKVYVRILFYLAPLIMTLTIEISQYVFNTGYCDIDDVILNTAGYYLGVLAMMICNALRYAVTRKKEKNLFD